MDDDGNKSFRATVIVGTINITNAQVVTTLEGKTVFAPGLTNSTATSKQYVDKKIHDLVNGADSALDTLKEIAKVRCERRLLSNW